MLLLLSNLDKFIQFEVGDLSIKMKNDIIDTVLYIEKQMGKIMLEQDIRRF